MKGKLKSCGTLTGKHVQILTAYIKHQVQSGNTDIDSILFEFYKGAINREPVSRALLLGNLPQAGSFVVNQYINDNKEGMGKEELDSLLALYGKTQAYNIAFYNAENIDEYLNKTIIDPAVEGIVEEEEETAEESEKDEETEEEVRLLKEAEEHARKLEEQEKEKQREKDEFEQILTEQAGEQEESKTQKSDRIDDNTDWLNALDTFGRIEIFSEDGTKFTIQKRTDPKTWEKTVNVMDGDETAVKGLSYEDFQEQYKGYKFRLLPVEPSSGTNTIKETLFEFAQTKQWIKDGLTKAYGNILDRAQSAWDYFTSDKKGLKAGKIAEVFKNKNIMFSRLFFHISENKTGSLKNAFPKNANVEFYLELSDNGDQRPINGTPLPYITVVAEEAGKNGITKTVISNIMPPTDESALMKSSGEDTDVLAYKRQYMALYNAVKGKKRIALKNDTKIEKIFLPLLMKGSPTNRIYKNEKDRINGVNPQKLKAKDYLTMLNSMGYGVSDIFIDMNQKNESAFSSGAFVAASPFHTKEEIHQILSNSDYSSGTSLMKISRENNINIIYLQRGDIGFMDYYNALAGNLNAVKYYDENDNLQNDDNKLNALLNASQSAYVHVRIGHILEDMQKKLEASRKAGKYDQELEAQFKKFVLYFFNDAVNYTLDGNEKDYARSVRKEIDNIYNGKGMKVAYFDKALENFDSWKKLDGADRWKKSEAMARQKYGYISNKQNAQEKNWKIQKEQIVKEMTGKPDLKSAHALSQGGMYGRDVVEFFSYVGSNKGLTKSAEKIFNATELTGANVPTPKFNASKDFRNISKTRFNSAITPAGRVNKGFGSKSEVTDFTQELLIAEEMPIMPHMVVSMNDLSEAAGIEISNTADQATDMAPDQDGAVEFKIINTRRSSHGRAKNRLFDNSIDAEFYDTSLEEASEIITSLVAEFANEISTSDVPLKTRDGIAIGQAYKNLLYLHSKNGKVSQKVLRHEIFHKVLNELLDHESYQKVMEEGYRMIEAEKGPGNYTAEQVDEFLARKYEDTFGIYRNETLAKLPKFIQKLYLGLKNLWLTLNGKYSEFNAVAEKLESGFYVSTKSVYDHYNGSSRNRTYSKSLTELAKIVGYGKTDEESFDMGNIYVEQMLTHIRSNALQVVYQNKELFLKSGMKLFTVEEAVNNYVSILKRSLIQKYGNPNFELIAKAIKSSKVIDLYADESLENDYFEVMLLENIDALREYAFDFYNFENEADFDYKPEIDSDLSTAQDEAAGTDSKLSQLIDRGALSATATMNGKVKFHIANTLTEDNEPVLASKMNTILTEMVNMVEKGPKGIFDINSFLKLMDRKLAELANAKTSAEYKTIKAIHKKYFDLTNPNSFLSLGIQVSDNPKLNAYYKKHMDVLTSMLSAYTTISVQEFLKPSFGARTSKTRQTNGNRSVIIKSDYNSNFLHNAFTKETKDGITKYNMNSKVVKGLFGGNENLSMRAIPGGFTFTVNKKSIDLTTKDTELASTGYTDIKQAWISKAMEQFDVHEINEIFKKIGYHFSQETINHYKRLEGSRNEDVVKRDAKIASFFKHAFMSYMLMGREAINQVAFNPAVTSNVLGEMDAKAKKMLNAMGKNRTDNPGNITNETSRGSAEALVEQTIFTPSYFHEFFTGIAQSQGLFSIGAASNQEYIGGAKHNKDKYNTPLKNRVKYATELKLNLIAEAKRNGYHGEAAINDYVRESYPNLVSAFYSNGIFSGKLIISDTFQLHAIESFVTGETKNFLDMNDIEFKRLLLTGMLSGKAEGNMNPYDSPKYLHPLDIQANRGYLPAVEAEGRYRGQRKGGRLEMGPQITEGLRSNYLQGFNSAYTMLNRIVQVDPSFMVDGKKLSSLLDLRMNSDQVRKIFLKVDSLLDAHLNANPQLIKLYPEHAVRQKTGGKYRLNQLIMAKINQSEQDYMAEQMAQFERFANDLLDVIVSGDDNYMNSDLTTSNAYSGAQHQDFVEGKEDSKRASFFRFKHVVSIIKHNRETEQKIQKLVQQNTPESLAEAALLQETYKSYDILNVTHQAVMDMYFTYKINNLSIRQVLFGELHTFKPQKGMDITTEAAYITEYSKRLTGGGTSKLNPIFRQELILADGNRITLNEEGLSPQIEIINTEDLEFHFADPANARFLDDIARYRTDGSPGAMARFKENMAGKSFEIDNGLIYTNELFKKLLSNSFGNAEGFPIKKLMKLIHNELDLGTGEVNYDKALNMVISPELFDNLEPLQQTYLQMMYAKGTFYNVDGSVSTLWDVYQQNYLETQNRHDAESAVYDAYIKARRDGTLISEPASYTNNRSTLKATTRNMNSNPISGNTGDGYIESVVTDKRDLSTGMGAVLDLTSDISDSDIALSSQMLYLLGIVGNENHVKVQDTYKALAKISGINSQKIEREINKLMKDAGNKEKNDAVRSWALEQIRKGYEAQGDFGAGYKLSQDPQSQSVSNPLHKNKMFGSIASRINKGISNRVKGFKGVQLPATNILFLYDTPMGSMLYSQMKKVYPDFEQRMLTGEIVKRNLSYASVSDGGITETETITGNFFNTKFGTGDLSINQVFTLTLKTGEPINIEANGYRSLSKSRESNYEFIKANINNIDWSINPAIAFTIQRAEKKFNGLKAKLEKLKKENAKKENLEILVKLIESEALKLEVLKGMVKGKEQKANVSGLVSMDIADSYLTMNRSLYGVMSRIPSTGKNSSSVYRIRAFIDGYDNGVFVPAEWLEITGSDHDGDTAMFWQFENRENSFSDVMLDSAVSVLSDIANASEIFSDIDSSMKFVQDFASQKMIERATRGFSYSMDDLFTMGEVRANNATGSLMTGAHALMSKGYGYSYIAKMQSLLKGKTDADYIAPDFVIGDEKPMGLIAEKSGNNEYVYKWLETLTNSAIDNAKYLALGALNLTRNNSDMQAAMAFLGFSKNTIADFFNDPDVFSIFKMAASYSDIGSEKFSYKPLEKALKRFFSLNKLGKPTFNASLAYISNPANQEAYDKKYIFHTVNVLIEYGKDFRKIQNALKVTNEIKGTPFEQRKQFDSIKKALDFKSFSEVRNFITEYEKAINNNGNALEMPSIASAKGAKNKFIDPKAVLALNPNLMAYLQNHVDFIEKTEAHLLYSEPMIRTRYMLEKMVDRKLLGRSFYKNRFDQAFYHQLSALFFDGFGTGVEVSSEINGMDLDLSSLENRLVFLNEFTSMVREMQLDPEYANNTFIANLSIVGNRIEIKESQNFGPETNLNILNNFRMLDQDVRDKVFYYMLLTDGLTFKKHGILNFISPEAHRNYNRFLKQLEHDPESIMENSIMEKFIHNFLLSNVDMLQDIGKWNLDETARLSLGDSQKVKPEHLNDQFLELNSNVVFSKSVKLVSFDAQSAKQIKVSKKQITKLEKEIPAALVEIDNIYSEIFEDAVDDEGFFTEKAENEINELINEGKLPKGFDQKVMPEEKALIKELIAKLEELSILKFTIEKAKAETEKVFDKVYKENDKLVTKYTPFRVVRDYRDGTAINHVMKLTEPDKVGGKMVWRQIQTLNTEKVMAYSATTTIPFATESESMASIDYDTYKHIKNGNQALVTNLDKLKGKKTNFFNRVDESGKFESFQLADPFSKAESPQKLMAIADIIQRAFPDIQIRFVKNQKGMRGNAKGFVSNGVVYINLDHATSDTPIHEVGHILIDLIEINNPELFHKLMEMVSSHPALIEISEKYQGLNQSETDNLKETFVTLLGMSQAEAFDTFSDAEADAYNSLFDEFWESVKEVYREILETLNVSNKTLSERLISKIDKDTSLQDIFNIIGSALVEGKVISDISSRQLAQLQALHMSKPALAVASALINAKIKELTNKGLIKRICK